MSKSIKVSHYDLAAKTHIVKVGVFPVEVYEQCDDWFYIARPYIDHPDSEATYALTKMHELLNGLAKHKYRLPQYLRSQNITLAWKQS
jgi:hypothetical protein